MENQEFNSLLNKLLNYHSIFYTFWKACRPTYSEQVDTACVAFDEKHNCIEFLINKQFWENLSDSKKAFIISHECWHIINSHSRRIGKEFNELANFAMDIVVNESLIKYFKFKREDIDPQNEYCWLDTCFTNEDNIEPWQNFEYYLNKLLLKNPNLNATYKLVSSHDGLSSLSQHQIKDIFSNLHEDELEVISNIISDSNKNYNKSFSTESSSPIIKELTEFKIHKKIKWESIIRKFEKKIKQSLAEDTHWAHRNRRLAGLSQQLFLPSEIEIDLRTIKSEKISTWFFMDTSGSCWGLADRFFKAAKTLDKNVFDVKFFFFDTKVYKADIESYRVIGGGGTSFKCVSNFIYNASKQNPYVWVLTDGYGDYPIIPKGKEKKWSWFLTESSCKNYIPQNSKIYDLINFE